MADQVKHDQFFQNRACAYFPCHKGIAEEDFNCMFCYCPLYTLGKACGGNYVYKASGVKSCKDCTVVHRKENCRMVFERHAEIMAVVRKMDGVDKV